MTTTLRLTAALLTVLVAGLSMQAGAATAIEINQTIADNGQAPCGGSPGLPCVITEPGSYILTSNLITTQDVHGIQVMVPNVTIDLNGFALIGAVECTDSGDGVTCQGPTHGSGVTCGEYELCENITVKNGRIRGFGSSGVGFHGHRNAVHDLTVTNCRSNGVSLYEGVVTGSEAYLNGSDGIAVSNSGLILDCVARRNGVDGIEVGSGGDVRNSIASKNYSVGIVADEGVLVSGCTIRANHWGVSLRNGSTVAESLIAANSGAGVYVAQDRRVNAYRDNTIFNNAADVDGVGGFYPPVNLGGNTCSGSACP